MIRTFAVPQTLYPMYVVILNWNLPLDTIACVESVWAGAPGGVNVVVVDNGSTDDSVALLQEHLGDRIILLTNADNLGFAAGVNAGIDWALEAGAQSVLLLNNDTVVDPSMILHLVAAATQSTRSGIVGPIIYYADQPDSVWRFGDRERRWLPVPLRLPDSVIAEAGETPFAVDYVTACGMLIRRDVLETIGLFDARYFFYFEDADYCRRARQSGYEIWCVPRAKMWHKVSLSARRAKPGTRYAEWWGRAHFYQDHPHGLSRGLTQAYLLVKLLATTARDILCKDWALVKPTWAGYMDGHSGQAARLSQFFE